MMQREEDQIEDPNHKNVIDISDDDEFGDYDLDDLDEGSSPERSTYFPSREVEAFNARMAQIPTLEPTRAPSKNHDATNKRDKGWKGGRGGHGNKSNYSKGGRKSSSGSRKASGAKDTSKKKSSWGKSSSGNSRMGGSGGGRGIGAMPTSVATFAISSGVVSVTPFSHLRALNITFLPLDITASSTSTLASTFTPFTTILSCTGFAGPAGTQLKLASAVLEAGVQHYYPWQWGVDYDIIGPRAGNGLFAEQCRVRELLRGQGGVKWTIVSTGMFMTFLFEGVFGVIENDKGEGGEGGTVLVRALGSWENKVTVTTPEDIAKVATELICKEGKQRTGVVFTAGDTVSYGELADMVEEKVGKEMVKRELWDLDYLRSELENDPENGLKRYRVVFAEGRGVSWDKGVTVNEERGIETTDLKSFLAAREKVVSSS
ncbi:MAG: hypothetical protein Q9183_005012 [Haloplaca sp. 2 TL-2023]